MYPTRKKSGGPKTPEGRAKCAGNALKTGAFSPAAILPWEKQDDFDALHQQFYEDFPPADPIEAGLLDQLIVLTWKRLRLRSLESSVLISMMRRVADTFDFEDSKIAVRAEQHVVAHAASLTDAEVEALRALIRSFEVLDKEGTLPTVEIELEHPELFAQILEDYELADADAVVARFVDAPDEWDEALHDAVGCAQTLLSAYERLDQVPYRLERYKEKRLLAFLEKGVFDRAGAEVDRSFSRAMAEWRKHREWRLKHALVQLEPANDSSARWADVSDPGTEP